MIDKSMLVRAIDQVVNEINSIGGISNADLILLGGSCIVHEGFQDKRDTKDVDFLTPQALEIAVEAPQKFGFSPVATGVSYNIDGRTHAEFFDRIEPDLSAREGVPYIVDEIYDRIKNKRMPHILTKGKVNVYRMPWDLFVVNKVASWNATHRQKDADDVKLVSKHNEIYPRFEQLIWEKLGEYKLYERYREMSSS